MFSESTYEAVTDIKLQFKQILLARFKVLRFPEGSDMSKWDAVAAMIEKGVPGSKVFDKTAKKFVEFKEALTSTLFGAFKER